MEVAREKDTSGIGLNNVKRRLELLYSNAHTLELVKDKTQHQIALKLQLNEGQLEKKSNSLMRSIHCVVIDDEPLAREGLINYINKIDFFAPHR